MKTPTEIILSDLVEGPWLAAVADRYGLPLHLFLDCLDQRQIDPHQPPPELPDHCEWVPDDEPAFHAAVAAGQDEEEAAERIERLVKIAVRLRIFHVDDAGKLQKWDKESLEPIDAAA